MSTQLCKNINKIFFLVFVSNQAQSLTAEETLKKQQEGSELINKQLQKDFEEHHSLTQALEAKVKV